MATEAEVRENARKIVERAKSFFTEQHITMCRNGFAMKGHPDNPKEYVGTDIDDPEVTQLCLSGALMRANKELRAEGAKLDPWICPDFRLAEQTVRNTVISFGADDPNWKRIGPRPVEGYENPIVTFNDRMADSTDDLVRALSKALEELT